MIGFKPLKPRKSLGASIPMQMQWKTMPTTNKIVNKILCKDSDRDGVPNKWDCQPFNKYKQDSKLTPQQRNMLKYSDSAINKMVNVHNGGDVPHMDSGSVDWSRTMMKWYPTLTKNELNAMKYYYDTDEQNQDDSIELGLDGPGTVRFRGKVYKIKDL